MFAPEKYGFINNCVLDRPKSAMLQAVEDKVFSITFSKEESDDDDDDDDDTDEEDGGVEADIIAHQDEDIDIEDDMVRLSCNFLIQL